MPAPGTGRLSAPRGCDGDAVPCRPPRCPRPRPTSWGLGLCLLSPSARLLLDLGLTLLSKSSPHSHLQTPFSQTQSHSQFEGTRARGGGRGGDATRHGIRLFLGDGGCVSRGWGPRPDFARRRDHPVCQNKTCALGRAERGQHPVPHCSDSAADWSVTEPSRSDSGTFRLSWKCGVRVLKSQGP